MPKTIKFNLIVDGKPVRDLEGLQQNFNIDCVYSHYKSGLLMRWLEVRGYDEYLNKVKAIQSDDEMSIVTELIKIFEVTIDESEIKKSVYAIQFKKQEQDSLKELQNAKFEHNLVIKKYHDGYNKLLNDIVKNKEDFDYIKQAIREISENYFELFQLDYINFYYKMIDEAYLAIFAALMNEKLRNFFLPDESKKSEIYNVFNNRLKKLVEVLYSSQTTSFTSLKINEKVYQPLLEKHFKVFGGETDGYWKDIEPKGKKCMIINIYKGNYVRNAGKSGEELGSDDVNGKFLILDGIDYKSNNANHKLIYMEV